MNSLEELVLALLQLVGRKVFPVSRLFTISMSVRSSFLHDVLQNRKKNHRKWCTASLRLSSCPDLSWVCSTRKSSDRLLWALITLRVISSCPDRSEALSSSWKPFSSISWEREVAPSSPNTSCLVSGCPDLSQIGFGIGWVSWENVACRTSPRDCRTTLPSGYWSTVEPSGTSPVAQSWSCRNEIFGGSRSDMLTFSYKTSLQFSV